MRKNGFVIFVITLIVLVFFGALLRHVAIAPIGLIIIVYIVVRILRSGGRNNRNETEEENTYRKDPEETQSDWSNRKAENTGFAGSAQKTEETAGSAGKKETGKNNDNPYITCEYCGSLIDTSKHGSCNHCGGTFWDNEEWKKIQNRRNSAK